MEPTKHKSVYIEQSIKQLGEHQIAMESYRQGIDQRIESFEDDIRGHLWVTDDFVEPASQGLDKTRADVEKLLDRLAEVVKGFEALPREEEALLREEEQDPSERRGARGREAVPDSQSPVAIAPREHGGGADGPKKAAENVDDPVSKRHERIRPAVASGSASEPEGRVRRGRPTLPI